ncbi:hypothetical protein GQX73_g10939 [Xylaria multiplex]|uniref:DUF676 domain-containing protein n=1 Tax=Xylaria multiplex TaxID=323545 RepID=A0A7C8MLV7_9PEZI|nr:hypothetical protein GQX73_g10939 [Xylaria multiplex]
MSSESCDPSSAAGPSAAGRAGPVSHPTSPSQYGLKLLSNQKDGDPVVDIILVGDISIPVQSPWGLGTDFPWPEKIPSVDVFEFCYPVDEVATSNNQANAIEALGKNISWKAICDRARKLKEAVNNPNRFTQIRRASHVILVGYGYGGLLCERVITLSPQNSPASDIIKGLVLFGTPNFSHGLRQWAHIVVKATAKEEVGAVSTGASVKMRDTIAKLFTQGPGRSKDMPNLASLEGYYRRISRFQRQFFDITREPGWEAKIVSCFPESSPSSPEQSLTILPEWSTIPHAFPISVRKPYLKMTTFDGGDEQEYQVLSRLIGEWIKKMVDNQGETPSI